LFSLQKTFLKCLCFLTYFSWPGGKEINTVVFSPIRPTILETNERKIQRKNKNNKDFEALVSLSEFKNPWGTVRIR